MHCGRDTHQLGQPSLYRVVEIARRVEVKICGQFIHIHTSRAGGMPRLTLDVNSHIHFMVFRRTDLD